KVILTRSGDAGVLSLIPAPTAAPTTYIAAGDGADQFPPNGSPNGLALRSNGFLTVASDSDANVATFDSGLHKVASYAGLGTPGAKALRVQSSGSALVANSDTGALIRLSAAGQPQVRAVAMTQPLSLAIAASGDIFVGGGQGRFYLVPATGGVVDLTSASSLY